MSKNLLLSLAGLALTTFFWAATAGAATTFRVTVPTSTPPGDVVYLAGDFQGWNPGNPAYALTKQLDGRWTLTLNLTNGVPIQFKFTRGTWAKVEKGTYGEEIANRTLTPTGTQTFDFTVASWADLGTITGHVESFTYAPFLSGRKCWVYLPPDYGSSTRRYSVLYMHDGQNLFDIRTSFAGEWRVDETCEQLISEQEIEPIIVVGIENSAARCTEYTPWPASNPNLCGSGGGADAYLQAIRNVLIPEVNRRYRTITGPAHTHMAGSSLGGLVSMYAGYQYDDVWGRVAAVSTSFWWANHQMFSYAGGQPKPNLARFYQDMGTAEGTFTDVNGNGIDDNIDDLRTMRGIALGQGFTESIDFLSVEAAGHSHNEYYWALRLPDILRFLIDAPATTAAPDPTTIDLGAIRGVFPNPFHSFTRIEYSLVEPGDVRLEIYDVSGRLVRTLAEGLRPAGSGTAAWDGRNEAGLETTAGTYWLRLTADGKTLSARRLVRVP